MVDAILKAGKPVEFTLTGIKASVGRYSKRLSNLIQNARRVKTSFTTLARRLKVC